MAQIVIPISSDQLKDEILAAFSQQYTNPDSVSAEDLAVRHISNFVREILNKKREAEALSELVVSKVESI